MHMKLLLDVIYICLKSYVRLALAIYFSRRAYVDEHLLPQRGPTIIATTHACTVFDPLLVAVRSRAQIHFLANYSLFKHPVAGWLLRRLFCIPVQRPKDVGGHALDNEAAFAQSRAFLQQGGTLYVAPEGTSYAFRRVRPFKTGFARIALDAEANAAGKLGAVVAPVSIHYLDPFSFRSQVVVQYAPPVRVADFLDVYKTDPFDAVHQLTEAVKTRIRELHVHTDNEEQDQLARAWEEVYATDNKQKLGVLETKRLEQQLEKQGISLNEKDPDSFAEQRWNAIQYARHLKEKGIDDNALREGQFWQASDGARHALFHIVGFPLFAYGGINNLLAFYPPYWIMKKMALYNAYDSTVKGVAGVVTVPLAYALQTYWVYARTGGIVWTLLYLASLMPSGIFALHYLDRWRDWQKLRRAAALWRRFPERMRELLVARPKPPVPDY
jgi:glycerol-3-phosphate O-acyltransferase/dihydroxyacetone phosphate acyltransferase